MGNQLARTTQISPSEYYLQDLPSTYNLVLKEALGGGRIFKSVQCVHDEGLLLVKVYFKRGELGPDLKEHDRRLRDIQTRLKNLDHSHVWPFQTWLETDKAAYLLRQYFFNNLHDRISTRPFLSVMEKKWLTFQLVYAVKQCHERGVCHGDIKCENILVTSWNWVYLSDFASFKPTYLPSDNPSDFSFFFDTGGRRRCYLAPERFDDPSSDPTMSSDALLKPAMDIFSMGCVIAELFLEGHALFDLSQLLAYRKGQYDPRPSLQKIPDERIQDMILHMIQLSPPARLSPDEYLQKWTPTVFPSYFSPLLHKFFSTLVPLDTDTRVARTQYAFAEIRKQMLAEVSSKGTQTGKGRDRSILQEIKNAEGSEADGGAVFDIGHLPGQGDVSSRFAATKYKAGGTLHRVKAAGVAMAHKQNPLRAPGEEIFNYKMEPAEIFSERAYTKGGATESQGLNSLRRQKENSFLNFDREGLDVAMAVGGGLKNAAASLDQQPKCEGMILIAALLCACLRNARLPQARRGAIQLLHEAARYCDNDARLQHILPYVVALLSDPAAIVRCAALQNMCNLLTMVENVPPSDAKIFPEYILPLLSMIPDDPEESVRIAYANNIHKIARASYRFLVSSQYLNEIGGVLDSPMRPQKAAALHLREVELSHLRETIARVIQELVMGHKQTPTIGRALLQHVGSLCPFFGQKQSNDFLLPILPAFLNDRDEQLRAVFFEHIVHVCLFVGQASLEAYLLPYIEQALSDVEETVIVNALECLAALCVHKLLRKRVVLEAVDRASPLLCHPSQCVQRAAVTFVSATSASLEPVDSHAFLSPILRPFLRREPASLCSEDSILVCLKPPVSREVFNRVLSNVMLSQTLPEAGPVKLRSKGRQRVAPIQPPLEFGGQSLVGNSERRKADKDASNSLAVSEVRSKHAFPVRKSSAAGIPYPGSNERPSSASENEDGEKMKAMEGYIRNLSSTMQTRMHNWEVENTEKLESSAVGLPPGVGAGYYSHFDGSSEGIPLYSVPLAERKSEGGAPGQSNLIVPTASSYNEDWSRIFGTRQTGTPFQMAPVGGSLGPASSQWAAIASNASSPTGEPMQRSIANVPIAPRFMAGSLYHAVSTTGPRRVYEVMREGGREGEGSYMASTSDLGMDGIGNAPIEPTFEVYPAPDSVTALLGSVHLGQSAIESCWRPKGVLIAHLQEHQRTVNEVSVSSDQLFFVSGSDDGTVKVWDCRRLERDISFRSRLTYDFPSGRVLCVKMLSDGHQVAAASSSGAIHVLNVDYQARLGGSNERYTGFSDIRKLDSDEGAVLSLENFVPEGPPHLLYSTQRSRTHLWDLRSPNEAWVLKGDPARGYTSATALDPNCNWLVTGTSRGVLTLWDLRFQIPANTWQLPLGCPVESMCPLLPRTATLLSSSARPFIYVAAGQDEIALWNAEDGSCHQVMRLAPDTDTELRDIPAALAPLAPNAKFGPSTTASSKYSSVPNAKDYRMEELNEPPPRLGGVRALFPLAGGTGLLTGGTDCRVRMWDRIRPEHSYTVCGPSGKALEQVGYETSLVSGVRIIQEHTGGDKQNVHTQGRRSPGVKNGVVAAALDNVGCHRDCIRSIASAQVNQKVLISSGRDGAIKVWK